MKKQTVLFLCNDNSARSQMAEALLRKHAGDRFETFSAGLSPHGIDPMTPMVLQEIGIDTSSFSAKSLDVFMGFKNFDYLIFVCETAEKNCPTLFPTIGQRLIWPFEDPSDFSGDYRQRLDFFRVTRDKIEQKILMFLAE